VAGDVEDEKKEKHDKILAYYDCRPHAIIIVK
jgi:hypothetical protein